MPTWQEVTGLFPPLSPSCPGLRQQLTPTAGNDDSPGAHRRHWCWPHRTRPHGEPRLHVCLACFAVCFFRRSGCSSIHTSVREAKVLAICDVNEAAAKELAETFHIPKYCSDPDEIFSDPNIHAVFICTPNVLHCEQVIRAAGFGKHIFCEKPLGVNLQEVRILYELYVFYSSFVMIPIDSACDPGCQRCRCQAANRIPAPL